MAIKRFLTEDQKQELQNLYDEFTGASSLAAAALQAHGMASSEFAAADHSAGEIMERINKLLGRRHWMG